MKKCTTFSELLKLLDKSLVAKATEQFNTDHYCKSFKTWDHLVSLLYTHFYEVKSLRELEFVFRYQGLGIPEVVRGEANRSTLSDANKRRTASCFFWIAEQLMEALPRKKRREIKRKMRVLDSSPIQLKGRGFEEWTACNRTLRCQGMKLHVEYDGQLVVPRHVVLSEANYDDCRMGQRWPIAPDTVYVFDRGYYDFNWWWQIKEKRSFFVTRLKRNTVVARRGIFSAGGGKVQADEVIYLANRTPRGGKRNDYQEALRRITVYREGKEEPLILVTNIWDVSAEVIADLYQERWGIELFFKWMKQHLRIKTFLGRSENAVRLQIAAALIAYLLLSLYRLACGERVTLHQLLICIRRDCSLGKVLAQINRPPGFYLNRPIWANYLPRGDTQ